MATATKKPRASRHVPRRTVSEETAVSETTAITFLVFEDNGGRYRWTLLGPDGDNLANSRPYATQEEAAQATLVVRNGVSTALFEADVAIDLPADLAARRRAAIARDNSDAERWLDEGGSFSSERVTPGPG